MRFIEQFDASESHGVQSPDGAESEVPDGDEVTYGGARVGDLVQWESQGALQFPKPLRVRMVSDDGQWIAVEGSKTGIPMNEVIVDTPANKQAPTVPTFEFEDKRADQGFEEWFRAKVGPDKQVMISYRGENDIGAKEIQKLIDMLAAQKAALED